MPALESKLTVLVNSCDKYSDLWNPFFTLYKKYADSLKCQIFLNTESMDFSFKGLEIKCLHLPDIKKKKKYSARMTYCLNQISSEYVLVLLDDFFLREPIKIDVINQIIEWMDEDKSIVSFNCDVNNKPYIDKKSEYQTYQRLYPGNSYILTLQAAIWRTKSFRNYWKYDVSPWEWEEYTNIIASTNFNEKFYSAVSIKDRFCNYGNDCEIWGVYRGKWVGNDIVPLFEREGITVDYSIRGLFNRGKSADGKNQSEFAIRKNEMPRTTKPNYAFVERVLGTKYKKKYKRFVRKNQVLNILNC